MSEYSEKSGQPNIVLATGGVVLLLLLFLWFYFGEPSQFGMESNRLADFFVMPSMALFMFGDGAQPIAILDRLPFVFAAASWLLLATVIGFPVVSLAMPQAARVLTYSLACLAGLALLSTLTLLMGLIGLLGTRWPLGGAVIVVAFAAIILTRRFKLSFTGSGSSGSADRASKVEDPLTPTNVGSLWCRRLLPPAVIVLGVCYALGSVLPPWEFDVLEYHLQAPKEFWQAGAIRFLPHNVYANMPLGAEMHSLALMTIIGGESGWWFGGIAGKLVTGMVSVVTAMMVFAFLDSRCGRGAAWAGAGLLLAAPGNIHAAMAGLIDMVLAGYVVATFMALLNVRATSSMPPPEKGGLPVLDHCCGGQGRAMAQWGLVGILCGGAAACKYPGVLLAVAPAIGWLLFSSRKSFALLPMLTLAVALLMTCGPWFIRNAVWTGNPVYPLANSVFDATGMTADGIKSWNQVHSPQAGAAGESPYRLSSLWQDLRKPLLSSAFTSPFLMFLAVVGFGAVWGRPRKNWLVGVLGLAVWILSVWWLATHRIDRFWFPLLPLFALAAGYGVSLIAGRSYRFVACAIPLIGVLVGLLTAVGGASRNDNRYFVAHDVLEAESTMEDSIGMLTPTAWINSSLTSEDRVLCVGFAKPFLLRIENAYSTCFNDSPAELLLREKEPAEQRKAMAESGFTYLFVDWREIRRYRSPGNYGFSEWPTPEDVKQLIDNGIVRAVETRFDPADLQVLEVMK